MDRSPLNEPLPLAELLQSSDIQLRQKLLAEQWALEEAKVLQSEAEAAVTKSQRKFDALSDRYAMLSKADERVESLFLEAGKALAVLNSAGVAAVLAFSQALVAKGNFEKFRPYALGSLLLFLVGAFIASIVAVGIAHDVLARVSEESKLKPRSLYVIFVGVAMVTFAAGAGVFMMGMAWAL